ncbi:MAG: hypothetical protein ACI4Q6_01635 [Huintestinicola sp.]
MKKIKSIALIILLLMTYAYTGCSSDNEYEEKYFGKDTYLETKHICNNEDKIIVQPILDQIENAFSYIGESNDCKKKFGALSRYCLSLSDVVSETHDIQFITAKTEGNYGYIWIRYSQEGFNKNNQRVVGSWDVLSRIEIEKIDDVWMAIEVNEHP